MVMMLSGKSRRAGVIVVTFLGAVLLTPIAHGQDAAWEGLINAGRNALQQQNFSEAERHFESALEAAERFPSGDARLGKSYNNLAAVYYAQEDYERAEPLMRRALAQLQEALGTENTEVAQTMKNLAALYYLRGDRREAEGLLQQSLAIMEQVHGPNHAFVATVLSNLAGLYQAEGRYPDAEPLLTRSLEIWESLLGADHPDVVRSRTLLARVRQARGGVAVDDAEAANPTALTPLATEGAEGGGEPSDATAEVARATTALEALTETSRVGADDAAAPEPAAAERASEAPATGQVTSAIGSVRAEQNQTTAAVLDQAASADDVSFAVYLSTLWSIDEAQRYWQALQDVMPDVLGNKELEIVEVAAGGGEDPFYRVLTRPFTTDLEAQGVCEQIRSELRTHDCSVVVRNAEDGTAGG